MRYLDYDDKTWCVDVETDGLHPTVIWVLVAGNMATGEEVVLTDMEEMGRWIEEKRLAGHKFVFHNGLHFDGPVLNKLAGTKLSVASVVDTFLIACLWSPSYPGGHSLDMWGDRALIPKIKHDDWSILSPEMIDRCKGDVAITKWLYAYLCRKMKGIGFSEMSIMLEHAAWMLVRTQKINGFGFDMARAADLRASLLDVANDLYVKLQEFFPPVLEVVQEYKQARKADGSYGKNFIENKERYVKLVELPPHDVLDNRGVMRTYYPYEAWDYVSFDPASPPQRVEKLLALGWEPREFTPPSKTHPDGQPQPTRKGQLVPSLQEFVDDQKEDTGVVTLVNWMTANGRASMIKTWMDAYDPDDGCIHGTLWIANTLRYKHSGPNTANIPALKMDETDKEHPVPIMGATGGWAYECRDLWVTRDPERRSMVGVDAKGIQLRVLAHYLNDDDFTVAILSEDPHAANAVMMDLPGRGIAKTITYAIVMGAGDQKIADTARITLKEAKTNKAKFFDKVPGLRKLIGRLKAERKKDGRITLCDGARIIVEQEHTVIPYLLQGDESRIMKKAKIIATRMIREQGLDVLWAGDIHDEWQADVLNDHIEAFKAICVIAFKQAGEYFNYNLPIDCDAKVGLTWAETH